MWMLCFFRCLDMRMVRGIVTGLSPAGHQCNTIWVSVSPFVSENDVRMAITRHQKIFIGPKTILTPSARDLGTEHEVFVDTTN